MGVLLSCTSKPTHVSVEGGHDSVVALHRENKLLPMMDTPHNFDYDLIVIGGGSGGLSAAKVSSSANIHCVPILLMDPYECHGCLIVVCINLW